MEQRIQFCATADRVRIAYATVGEGPPIMKAANWLSHLEWDWQSPIWRHMLAEFARDHSFIRYDERGNGLSDWNCEDLSFNAWVEDLAAVVDAAGLDRFPLLGISQGGAVAIAYAVRYPEKVSHLILYGAYARGWAKRDSPEEIEQRQAQLTLVKLGWGKDNPAFRQLWTTLYAPDATPEQAQSFNDLQKISTSPENAVRLLAEMGNIDVVSLLPQVKVPTLVLHCREEAGVPFEEGREIAGSIPGARFVPLKGRNHLLLEGDPSWPLFVKEVRRFIGAEDTSALKQSTASVVAHPDLQRSDLPDRYRIVSFLGVGGMGEVYLAEDTKLGRKVAIKTLPANFTNDRERLRRFQHEARTASALNHPNILTIHEVDMEGGANFIAAEFIDGDTLRTRIKRGRMKVEEALDVAQQSAFALTAAHGAGIIHRDIKPENIMVRHDGIVKVLDFGLAKLLEDQARNIDSEAETQVHTLTEAGRVLGTPAYMSPEQARGRELDARTDIWSLGVVLYEMVTGRPPFRGETKSHTVVSILETEPLPLNELAPNTPPELQRIVRKALTKDRDSRYQTARDLMIDLKNLRRELDLQSELDRSAGASSRSNSTAAITARSISAASSGDLTARDTRTDLGFYQRHKTLVIVGAVVLAMLVLGGIILSVAGVVAYWRAKNLPPAQTINSIAVLPFANQNSDANSEYLSDGLTESVINNLSQLPNTKVLARTTVFRYKGQEADPHKVGSELGVDALLTGKVSQQGDTLIIQADLVRVRDGAQLWGARYHRKMADIFAVQSEIASEISQTLRRKLTSDEQKRVTKRPTESVEAYQWYLKGRYEASRFSPLAVPKAIEYFNRAIAADPNYAAPHAGLARIYGLTAHMMKPPGEAYPRAKAEAEKALALDDQSEEAHVAASMAYFFYDWNFAAAQNDMRRALELNPNFAEAYAHYSGYFKAMRNYPEEIAQATKGRDLDPLSPFANMELGEAFYHARRYDEAIDQINKTLALDPNLVGFAYHVRARAYEQKGMFTEAVADCRRWSAALDDKDPMALATLAHAYAAMGNTAEAKKLLDQILKMRGDRFLSAYWIGYVYVGMNDKDRAFEYFNKAIDERYFMMVWITSEPRFDNLRSDPRFAELVRRVGLPQ